MNTGSTRRWILPLALAVTAALGGLVGGVVAGVPAMGAPMMGGGGGGMWQYNCLANPGDPDVGKFNKLGHEGWELVAFKGTSHACFKKPGGAEDVVVLPPDSRYDTEAVKDFAELASATGGRPYGAPSAAEVPGIIRRIIEESVPVGVEVDLAFVIDVTGSMGDDIEKVKGAAKDILDVLVKRSRNARVGVVSYKDKGDDFVARVELDLNKSMPAVRAAIGRLTVGGGGDWPEHVYQGLMTAMNDLWWSPSAVRLVILMGDAPPHDDYAEFPKRSDVIARATKWGGEIAVYPIVVGR